VAAGIARIAFADLRRIADWGPDGLVVKTPEAPSDANAAATSESSPVPERGVIG
jgi:hypothetical protein